MRVVDVVFPLSLGPLTYRVPERLQGAVAPGVFVEAPLKKSLKRGVVLREAGQEQEGARDIHAVALAGEGLSAPLLKLLQWMAGYYFASEGMVLKSAYPRELLEPVVPRGQGKAAAAAAGHALPLAPLKPEDTGALDEMAERARKGYYRTFLLHAPSVAYEVSFVLEAAKRLGNVLVLVPDHAGVRRLAPLLEEAAPGRLALYHSGLSRGLRSRALRRIASGEADVVLGSRMAVFAPLNRVSLIAVLQEESPAYKEEGGVLYGGRDVAVMRGYLEGAPVLLTSVCPSVESWFNAREGKYTLLDRSRAGGRPRVRVIDMRGSEAPVSRSLKEAARKRLHQGERAMFYINRTGYSILRCGECGLLLTCERCAVPLVFHKRSHALRCHSCAAETRPPETCPRCGGAAFLSPGAGLERVQEDLEELAPVSVKARDRKSLTVLEAGSAAVGTKTLIRGMGLTGAFSLAGVINADAFLTLPDFRAGERAFADLVYAAEKVAPGGELFLQSRNPGSRHLRRLRRFDFAGFYADELESRAALSYPPFARLALITAEAEGSAPSLPPLRGEAEVMGPLPAVNKRGRKVFKVLVKAPGRAGLTAAVRAVLRAWRGRRLAVDVDPASL
jgi:primosomal protein N' (replication factor Y)